MTKRRQVVGWMLAALLLTAADSTITRGDEPNPGQPLITQVQITKHTVGGSPLEATIKYELWLAKNEKSADGVIVEPVTVTASGIGFDVGPVTTIKLNLPKPGEKTTDNSFSFPVKQKVFSTGTYRVKVTMKFTNAAGEQKPQVGEYNFQVK